MLVVFGDDAIQPLVARSHGADGPDRPGRHGTILAIGSSMMSVAP
jgi:hypothetical protein